MKPPFAVWAQPAVLSVPVTDAGRTAKASARGTSSLAGLLDRFAVTPPEIARRLGIDATAVGALLAADRATPAVMLDGEDSARGDAATVGAAFAEALSTLPWRSGTLRFVRVSPGPAGIRQLGEAAARLGRSGPLPHSVVLPKVTEPGAVVALVAELERLEAMLDGAPTIGIHLLIETAAGLAALAQLADAAGGRLAGLIFGALDYAAEIGLPDADDHVNPTLAAARARLVEAAALAGVPAIDGMTLAFPVAAGQPGARVSLLDAVGKAFDDALSAAGQGMAGKLVGHPAQLLAVLLAYGEVYSAERVHHWTSTIDAYQANEEGGVMTHNGRMVDAASVRQARTMLARAQAAGYVQGSPPAGEGGVPTAVGPLEAAR